MQKSARRNQPSNGSPPPCRSTVGLLVRLPNGGVMRVEAPIGQSISAALMAHGVPLRQVSTARTDARDCQITIPGERAQFSRETTIVPEHDGLEVTLDDMSVEPQTIWTAG